MSSLTHTLNTLASSSIQPQRPTVGATRDKPLQGPHISVVTHATFPPKSQALLCHASSHPPPTNTKEAKPTRAGHTHTHTERERERERGEQQQRSRTVTHLRSWSHGGEQQHHGLRDAHGAHLRGPRHRLGGLVRLRAGGGVRAPGAVARGHPGRAPPPGRPRRVRRRVLEPPRPPRLLPLRHGGAHRAPHRAARLRLRRNPRLRGVRGARPRLRRVPPRRLLHVAARLRLRRPRPVGARQGLPRRLRHLQEARAAGRLRHRRPVLPVQPLAATVRLLQAAVGVRVQLREPDGVDEPGAPGGRPGLRPVEQRPGASLLRVRVLPRRPPRSAARPVAQGQHRPRRRHRRARLPLRRRLQRLQERAGRGHLPPPQVVRPQNLPCRAIYVNCISVGSVVFSDLICL